MDSRFTRGPILGHTYHLPHLPVHGYPFSDRIAAVQKLFGELLRNHRNQRASVAVARFDAASCQHARSHERKIIAAYVVERHPSRCLSGNLYSYLHPVAHAAQWDAACERRATYAGHCLVPGAYLLAPTRGRPLETTFHSHDEHLFPGIDRWSHRGGVSSALDKLHRHAEKQHSDGNLRRHHGPFPPLPPDSASQPLIRLQYFHHIQAPCMTNRRQPCQQHGGDSSSH